MTTDQLLALKTNTTLLVKNDPFEYKGRAEVTLEGSELVYWLFSDEGAFIYLNPKTDETIFYRPAESDLETDEEGAVYEGEPYELSTEDRGTVTAVFDETAVEEGDVFNFTDYENNVGRLIRAQENESTGESQVFVGTVLVEEETVVVEN
ncbi:MAG: DUF4178 domain-containing protein [Patescibacteria group bacterium]|jgi:hypothetical protein